MHSQKPKVEKKTGTELRTAILNVLGQFLLTGMDLRSKHNIVETIRDEDMESFINEYEAHTGEKIGEADAWVKIRESYLEQMHQLMLQTTEVLYEGIHGRQADLEKIKENTTKANNNPRVPKTLLNNRRPLTK